MTVEVLLVERGIQGPHWAPQLGSPTLGWQAPTRLGFQGQWESQKAMGNRNSKEHTQSLTCSRILSISSNLKESWIRSIWWSWKASWRCRKQWNTHWDDSCWQPYLLLLYISCLTSACFIYISPTCLTFLHTYSRSQLMIVLIKGAVRYVALCWFPW